MTLAEYITDHALPTGACLADPEITALDVTPGSHRKVRWRCEAGHEWEATVHSVALDGCSCPYCAGRLPVKGENDLAALHPELALQWDREKNGSEPDSVLPSAHKKVWWRCALGHSWAAAPFVRTGGSGCPYCTGKKVLPGFNDLATLKPAVAEQWHPTLNGALTAREVSPGSNKNVWWRCREHHVWQAAVYSRTRKRGSGCPVCAGIVKRAGRFPQEQPVPEFTPVQTDVPIAVDLDD